MKSIDPLLAPKDNHEEWTPLLELAAREVFELMLSSQLTVSATAEEPNLEITSMVGLAGQLCGVLSVRCSGKAATLMASKMLGIEVDKVGAEMPDAVGEVCNMVAGNFKNKIAGLGEGCMLSPPTVITGNDYSLHSLADPPLSPGYCLKICPSSSPSRSTASLQSEATDQSCLDRRTPWRFPD